MKKPELIADVAQRSGQSKDTVRSVIDALRASIEAAIASGADAALFGLGKLAVVKRGEKKARNIWTGETVIVPPRRAVVFKPSDSVEHALNPDRKARAQDVVEG